MSSHRVILVFPGQGSQYIGMAEDWAAEHPEMARTLEEASDVLGMDMARLCFEDTQKQLDLTHFTQPAILAISIGILRVLTRRWSIEPAIVAGHSLGEYSALVSVGALSFSDALRTVRFRGEAMHRATPLGVGAMAAYVGEHRDQVIELCEQVSAPGSVVEVANFNSPTQTVLSGNIAAIERIEAEISRRELGALIKLPVSAAFHSSLMSHAAEDLRRWLAGIELWALRYPLCANADASIYVNDEYKTQLLVRQMTSPVLWMQSVHRINQEVPKALWIEMGPGKVLSK